MILMCGRFCSQAPSSTIRERFQVEPPVDYRGRTNVAPTQPVLAICRREGGHWRFLANIRRVFAATRCAFADE